MQLINNNKWIYVALVCLVLYFQHSWVPGMFHDGYLYVAFGKNAAERGHWLIPFLSETEYPRFDHHPVFYFILEGLWFKIFNFSWTSARVFGLLWMLASVLSFYGLLKRKFSEKLALTSSFILLLMPSLLKKSRFPNLDFPLLLSAIVIMLLVVKAPKEKLGKTWFIIGLFGGLALLIKGASAIFIMGITGLYLLLSKEDRPQLTSPWPYFGIILSFGIFALWPLALYLDGNISIFQSYFEGQVIGSVIKGRNLPETDYLLYFKHLLKTTLPWLILAGIGFRSFREKEKSLFTLSLVWLLLPLFVFSLIRVKYSNYLIPLYPPIAILAGYQLTRLKDETYKNVSNGFKGLMVLVTLVLLIFPVTNKPRRHVETFDMFKQLEDNNFKPDKVVFVDTDYEYYSTVSLFSIFYKGNPYRVDSSSLSSNLSKLNNSLLIAPIGNTLNEKYENIRKLKDYPQKGVSIYFNP